MFKLIKTYFNWLQKDAPTGDVTLYPELDPSGETSLKNVYIIGDLTGIPLLKFATNGGARIVRKFASMKEAISYKTHFDNILESLPQIDQKDVLDLVIVGAGPAGISAALEAEKRGLSYVVLEGSARAFNTIQDFPKGKEIFYEPEELVEDGDLTLEGPTKEKLLDHICGILDKSTLKIDYNKKVSQIDAAEGNLTVVHTDNGAAYIAKKTLLAIGKTGSFRTLNVPGEDSDHVFNRLFDPKDYLGQKVLVIGGGDTAVETAILLANSGIDVSFSYRKAELTRPKVDNVLQFNALVEAGKITAYMGSNVTEIQDGVTVLNDADSQVIEVGADSVFVMIGRELPYDFFRKSGIKIENETSAMTYWWMAFSIFFGNIIYFGKASQALWGEWSNLSSLGGWDMAITLVSWLSVPGLAVTGIVVLVDLLRNWKHYFKTKWHYIKYGYFAFIIVLFLISFLGNKYFGWSLLEQDPYFWYGFLYTTTIGLFGIRRIIVSKSEYITKQTTLLFLIQALPLFIIPNFVLPAMHSAGWISPWVFEHVFLGGEWWRSVGFILAWPLFIWNIFTDEPSLFWLIVSLVQTFVIIPFLVIKWGKGAYCSWICSCGAMAETLGDEYRTKAWHGPLAKKMENLGQVILFAIFLISILHIMGWNPQWSETLAGLNDALLNGYKVFVDILLAGTIGVGLYFFYSGRVWCRFACPLAALMHIYNKFSCWRILAEKKKCISCGLCTKACHMGIDVMSYAQQGKSLDDVECVNCSACIEACPTGVLSFGDYKKIWKK